MTITEIHTYQTFCIIACPRSIVISKSSWLSKSFWNLLQNLSNRDFLAKFVQKLCRYEHIWPKSCSENGSQTVSKSAVSLSKMNNIIRLARKRQIGHIKVPVVLWYFYSVRVNNRVWKDGHFSFDQTRPSGQWCVPMHWKAMIELGITKALHMDHLTDHMTDGQK